MSQVEAASKLNVRDDSQPYHPPSFPASLQGEAILMRSILMTLTHPPFVLSPSCRAVNPNPEPDWSSAHRGLCLYVSRLLQPVWDQRVASPKGKGGLLACRFSGESVEVRGAVLSQGEVTPLRP